MSDLRQIGQVALDLGTNPKTIRYYEEINLIPNPQRNEIGYRVYSAYDVEQIAFVLRARQLDFSLDDIGEILAYKENGEVPCLYVTGLINERLADVDRKIGELKTLQKELKAIKKQAESLPAEAIENKDCVCHLIENEAIKHKT